MSKQVISSRALQAQVLRDLYSCANELDSKELFAEADAVSLVMKKLAQYGPYNEAGEPIMSGEDWAREQRADEQSAWERQFDEDDRDDPRHMAENDRAEEQSEKFQDLFDLWASEQNPEELQYATANYVTGAKQAWMDSQASEIAMRQQRYPDTFDVNQYINNKMPLGLKHFDLKEAAEYWILGNKQSQHQNWFNDPDTMHEVLDAIKNAMLSGGDIMSAINSVPAEGQDSYYEGPEDFGWDGGREE